jgi:hypothetical protein
MTCLLSSDDLVLESDSTSAVKVQEPSGRTSHEVKMFLAVSFKRAIRRININ